MVRTITIKAGCSPGITCAGSYESNSALLTCARTELAALAFAATRPDFRF